MRANAILPGWIDTPMTERALHGEAFNDKVLPRVPMRRWGVPATTSAASRSTSPATPARYHTGDTFVIDGGYPIF